MKLNYTYFPAKEGGYVAFFDDYPDWWTEAESIPELESMLKSLWKDAGDLMDNENSLSYMRPANLFHGFVNVYTAEAVPA